MNSKYKGNTFSTELNTARNTSTILAVGKSIGKIKDIRIKFHFLIKKARPREISSASAIKTGTQRKISAILFLKARRKNSFCMVSI